MLAAFAGWVIIGRVPAILHTPLMSGSNFVHGIVVVGGMYALLNAGTVLEQAIGFFAVLLGAGNAAGGYRRDRAHAGDVPDQRARRPSMPNTATPRASHREDGLRNAMTMTMASATDHRRHRSRGRLPVHVRPEAHVVAGDRAIRHLRRRHRHARRGVRELSLRLRCQRGGQAAICWSISASRVVALVVGGGVAWWSGKRVAMTAMPQMVALYNGMGGGAAGAIAAVELFGDKAHGRDAARRHVARRADRRGFALRLAHRLGQAGRGHQKAAALLGPAGLQRRRPPRPRSPSAATSFSWRRRRRHPDRRRPT